MDRAWNPDLRLRQIDGHGTLDSHAAQSGEQKRYVPFKGAGGGVRAQVEQGDGSLAGIASRGHIRVQKDLSYSNFARVTRLPANL